MFKLFEDLLLCFIVKCLTKCWVLRFFVKAAFAVASTTANKKTYSKTFTICDVCLSYRTIFHSLISSTFNSIMLDALFDFSLFANIECSRVVSCYVAGHSTKALDVITSTFRAYLTNVILISAILTSINRNVYSKIWNVMIHRIVYKLFHCSYVVLSRRI